MTFSVSVVVCTWNRVTLLRDTVQSLLACSIPEGMSLELIVVDNASTDETPAFLRECRELGAIRTIYESAPGLSNARNAGASSSSGDWIVFLDDDVLVPREYFVELLYALRRFENVDFWAAPVNPVFDEPVPEWLPSVVKRHPWCYSALDLKRPHGPLEPSQFPFGANMAVRRSLALSNPFSNQYGFTHGTAVPGEETDFFARLRAKGAVGWWAPAPAVQHRMPANRANIMYLMRRAFGQGRADLRTARVASRSSLWVPRELSVRLMLLPLDALRGSDVVVVRLVDIVRLFGHVVEWIHAR